MSELFGYFSWTPLYPAMALLYSPRLCQSEPMANWALGACFENGALSLTLVSICWTLLPASCDLMPAKLCLMSPLAAARATSDCFWRAVP